MSSPDGISSICSTFFGLPELCFSPSSSRKAADKFKVLVGSGTALVAVLDFLQQGIPVFSGGRPVVVPPLFIRALELPLDFPALDRDADLPLHPLLQPVHPADLTVHGYPVLTHLTPVALTMTRQFENVRSRCSARKGMSNPAIAGLVAGMALIRTTPE